MKLVPKTTMALALATAIPASAFADGKWYPYEAEQVSPAFSADGTVSAVTYTPLETAENAATQNEVGSTPTGPGVSH